MSQSEQTTSAEKRSKAGIKVEDDPPTILLEGSKGESVVKAAIKLNTSPTYVRDAKKLQKDAPDLLEKVRSGCRVGY